MKIPNKNAEVGAPALAENKNDIIHPKPTTLILKAQLQSVLFDFIMEIRRLDDLGRLFLSHSNIELDQDCSAFHRGISSLESTLVSWSDYLTKRGQR